MRFVHAVGRLCSLDNEGPRRLLAGGDSSLMVYKLGIMWYNGLTTKGQNDDNKNYAHRCGDR